MLIILVSTGGDEPWESHTLLNPGIAIGDLHEHPAGSEILIHRFKVEIELREGASGPEGFAGIPSGVLVEPGAESFPVTSIYAIVQPGIASFRILVVVPRNNRFPSLRIPTVWSLMTNPAGIS
jgi:hypothetical protein